MTERFTLLTELGRGGMGIVWKARDEESGQIVALKLLHPVFTADPDYVARFERELELARRIHSAHVVQVLGYGVRDGSPYLALEYIDGPSLRDRLASHGPYSWPETKVLLAQIAQGLADAHAAGVIHRDLKPSNVLIGSDGVPRIADFGIAKGLDLTRVTGTSTLLGTPAYLAPEGPKDVRSDLYSLGIIGYELLSGAVPFRGTTYQDVIVDHIRTAPDLSKLPTEARTVIGWLLAKDPKDRPQSAAELIAALAGWQGVPVLAAVAPAVAAAAPQSAPIVPPAHPPARWNRRGLAIGAGVAGLVLLVAAAAAAGSYLLLSVATPTPTLSPAATSQAIALATQSASPSPLRAATPTPTVTPTPTPEPTAPPTRKPAPQPTPTPVPAPTLTPTPQPTTAGAYISGVVTASESGVPIAGVDIWATGSGSTPKSYETTTRSDGSYSVGPVTPDRYDVWAREVAGRPWAFATVKGAPTCYRYTNSGTAWNTFDTFVVGSAGLSGVNIEMAPGYMIAGSVTPAPGESISADSDVYFYYLCNSQSTSGEYAAASDTSNAYEMGGLPPGSYLIRLVDNLKGNLLYWSSSGLTAQASSATPITLTSDITGFDIQLPPGF